MKVIFFADFAHPLRTLRLRILPQRTRRFTQSTQRKMAGYCRVKVYIHLCWKEKSPPFVGHTPSKPSDKIATLSTKK